MTLVLETFRRVKDDLFDRRWEWATGSLVAGALAAETSAGDWTWSAYVRRAWQVDYISSESGSSEDRHRAEVESKSAAVRLLLEGPDVEGGTDEETG